jgi:putative peptidoglycan lipid II flippase
MTDPHAEHREREQFFAAAKLVAGLTVVSRVGGLLRDIAITSLGATRTTSAFRLAFQIPNLFRRLFGEGALSAAFVPVFSSAVEQNGPDRGRALLGNCLALLGALLCALAAGASVAAWLWAMLAGGEAVLLASLLTIMLPFMVTVCLLGLASAALNCSGHFAYPAFAPVLLNVVIIVAAWGVAPHTGASVRAQLHLIAAAVPVAGVVQLAIAWRVLRRAGLRPPLRLRPVEPGVGAIARMMGPMILGLGFLQFSELLNSVLAWTLAATEADPTIPLGPYRLTKPLQAGALVRIEVARRLYQFPMGVLAISLGVAVFPLMSRYASRGDLPNLRLSINRAIRLAMMESLAAGMGLLVLAEPITRTLFEYRRFTADDAARSALILQCYSVGVWGICTYQIVARAFYALQDTRTPLKVACGSMLAALALTVALVWVPGLGAGAFGLATAAAAAGNTIALSVLLRRRVGPLGGRELAWSIARSALSSAAMGGVLWAMRSAMGGRPPWMVVLAGVPVGAATFLASAIALRMPEPQELLGSLRRRPDRD